MYFTGQSLDRQIYEAVIKLQQGKPAWVNSFGKDAMHFTCCP